MATREDMKAWVIKALKSLGGKGWPKDVAKYIWDHYEIELKSSGGHSLYMAIRCPLGCSGIAQFGHFEASPRPS